MPAVYLCPSRLNPVPGLTFYQGWSGPNAFFDPEQRMSLQKITDGTSNTIMVTEAGTAVPWTKPDDMPFDPNSTASFLELLDEFSDITLGLT